MKAYLIKSLSLILLTASSFSCKDDYVYSDLVRDNRPAIAVTFPGTTTYGFNPFITSSLAAGGPIQFTLSIPASSGRTIKEITKIVGGNGHQCRYVKCRYRYNGLQRSPDSGQRHYSCIHDHPCRFQDKVPNCGYSPRCVTQLYGDSVFVFGNIG
ncbi:hypothetical protein [Spirosoma telluris]|uniref:hypothetical protein n=1 Tax=Spirosoma telluris TaxID=2183553 RepID=UPI002FC3560E